MTSREKALWTFRIYEKARDKANMTDAAVAREAGIRPSSICDWKHGRYTPKADKLYCIAMVLGIPFELFMKGA